MAIMVEAGAAKERRLRGFLAETPTVAGRIGAFLTLILVFAPPLFTALMGTIVVPIIPAVTRDFGGGNGGAFVAQMMVTVPCIGVILGGPLAGWMVERFGFRPVIVGSAVLMSLAGAGSAFAHAIVPFLFLRLLVGFGAAGGYTALLTLSGTLFHGQTLARILGYQAAGSAVAAMGSIMLSGFIAEHVSWRLAYMLYLSLLVFVPIALWARWPREPVVAKARTAGLEAIRGVLPVLLLMIPIYAAAFMSVVQGSFMMTANGIVKPTVQSAIISMSTILFTISSWNYGRLRRWMAGYLTFALALLLLGGGIVVMGALTPLWAMALGCGMIGAGSGMAGPYLSQLVLERSPAEQRGRAVGLIAPAHYLGEFANPFMIQPLRMAFGIHAAFILFGATILMGAAAAVKWGRRSAPAGQEQRVAA